MKNFFASCLVVFTIISCHNDQNGKSGSDQQGAGTGVTDKTIPTIRKEINPKPVASFFKTVPDSLNSWHFSVGIYETKETFHYLMKMEYMELRETDTLKIPNIGIEP